MSDAESEALVETIKQAWGNKTIIRDGRKVWIPNVRDGGSTDQLIRLAVHIARAEVGTHG